VLKRGRNGLRDLPLRPDRAIAFTGGIGADSVVINVGGGNYTTLTGGASLDINNNGGAAGIARGIFLDPNGAISVTNAQVFGRVFGGDTHDFQDVSGTTLTVPMNPVPAPATITLALAAGFAFGFVGLFRKFCRPPVLVAV
jgi:hypothetical protein